MPIIFDFNFNYIGLLPFLDSTVAMMKPVLLAGRQSRYTYPHGGAGREDAQPLARDQQRQSWNDRLSLIWIYQISGETNMYIYRHSVTDRQSEGKKSL